MNVIDKNADLEKFWFTLGEHAGDERDQGTVG